MHVLVFWEVGIGAVGGWVGWGAGWAKDVRLDFYIYLMLRCCTFSWTSAQIVTTLL